jgi:hypothetical protein
MGGLHYSTLNLFASNWPSMCCELMVVRVHSAIKLVAWSATARMQAELVSCRQLASLGSVQLRS